MTEDKLEVSQVVSEYPTMNGFGEIPDFYNNMGTEVKICTSNLDKSSEIGQPNNNSKSSEKTLPSSKKDPQSFGNRKSSLPALD